MVQFRMRIYAITAILFLITPFCLTAEAERFKATVTDNLGETTDVYDLNLSNWALHRDRFIPTLDHREWDSYLSIRIMKGATELDIPLNNLSVVDFDWSSNPPIAEIETVER